MTYDEQANQGFQRAADLRSQGLEEQAQEVEFQAFLHAMIACMVRDQPGENDTLH